AIGASTARSSRQQSAPENRVQKSAAPGSVLASPVMVRSMRPPGTGARMIERLEAQKKLTANQWKLICTANIADLLDFFDFFLIGYVTAALTKEWSLTYWQGGAILLASGLGAVPGAFVWGWLGDKIGRRTVFLWSAVTISLATGVMVFTPGPDAIIPGWLFLMFFRLFVGVGNAGIFTIDLPLVQEFIPAYKRGWVSALVSGRACGDRRRLALPVGCDAARHRTQHDAGARGGSDGMGRTFRDRRPVFRLRPDRAAGAPRRRDPGLRNGRAADGDARIF